MNITLQGSGVKPTNCSLQGKVYPILVKEKIKTPYLIRKCPRLIPLVLVVCLEISSLISDMIPLK